MRLGKANRFWRNGHVVPFAVWLAGMLLLQVLESIGACPRWMYPWTYAAKSVLCAALFLWYRPWRLYPRLAFGSIPWSILGGTLVAVIWIFPESPWFGRAFPAAQRFYFEWLVMMPGSMPSYVDPAWWPELPPGHVSWAYSVGEAGWPLAIAKLIGSGLVIAVIEEFFFRGFLYRWLRQSTFWHERLMNFDWKSFLLVTAVFGFEHDRWFAGLLAGAVYGLLAIRAGDLWCAALAHCITNTLLGLYVIAERAYGFW